MIFTNQNLVQLLWILNYHTFFYNYKITFKRAWMFNFLNNLMFYQTFLFNFSAKRFIITWRTRHGGLTTTWAFGWVWSCNGAWNCPTPWNKSQYSFKMTTLSCPFILLIFNLFTISHLLLIKLISSKYFFSNVVVLSLLSLQIQFQ